ncbi:Uncharacterised protein [Mycobacteroides abscessus subsp. abscessus]|nr:Uncharacterised protein [Mycobacteroides abscessus subsp. abscessus]
MRDALGGLRIPLVGDDHPRGLAVGGHEQLHAAFEGGIVERLRRQVEGVVVLRVIEGLTQFCCGARGLLVLGVGAVVDRIVRQGQVAVLFLDGDLRGDQVHKFGLQGVELVKAAGDRLQCVDQLIDTVEGIEDGSQCRAEGDVEAVRLPVEIVSDGPELIVEVGDLVPQILCHRDGLLEPLGLFMCDGGTLFLQRQLLSQHGDGVRHLVGLLRKIQRLILLLGKIHQLAGARCADLKRDGRVGDWCAEGAGDRLDQGHTAGMENGFGDAFQQHHAGRIAHIEVGFDHQKFGVEARDGEMAFGGGIADVRRDRARHVDAAVVGGPVSR